MSPRARASDVTVARLQACAERPLTAARLQACVERPLTAAEVQASLGVPIGEEAREDVLSLIRWFRRRYPEPAERLAYVRRAYARWQRRPARR